MLHQALEEARFFGNVANIEMNCFMFVTIQQKCHFAYCLFLMGMAIQPP